MSSAGNQDNFNQEGSPSTQSGGFVQIVTDDKVTGIDLYDSDQNSYKVALSLKSTAGNVKTWTTSSSNTYTIPTNSPSFY